MTSLRRAITGTLVGGSVERVAGAVKMTNDLFDTTR